MGKDITGSAQEAMELLEAYDWPGNIRELENVIERAVALEKSQAILPESLPEHIVRRVRQGSGGRRVASRVGLRPRGARRRIRARVHRPGARRADGVQVKAAELLGMTFRSFRYYAKKYNLK